MERKCLNCNINPARIDKQIGVLYCDACRDRQRGYEKPHANIEFTSEEIKEGRRAHMKSIIQPWRDGVPSKEYADAYPEQAKKMFAKYKKSEIKEVWGDITPAGGIEKTK